MAEQQYTPEDIGLLVAALREGIVPQWWAPQTYYPMRDDGKRVAGEPGTYWPNPIAAILAAARGEG